MDRSIRMGEEPIPRLLLHFSLPAVAGLLANALYNLVDRIFVGQTVGALGIAGIAVAFPYVIAGIAFSLLIGVGSSALNSISLGEGKPERASRVLGNGMFLVLILGLPLVVAGRFLAEPVLTLSGATENIIGPGLEYLRIVSLGVPATLATIVLSHCIRAQGYPAYAMMVAFLGAGANIALDALFIFGFSMGIQGAAWATVISQYLATVASVWFFLSGRGSVRVHPAHFVPERVTLVRIFQIGMAPFLMELSFTLLVGWINRLLREYGGDLYISAMGIFFSLDSLLFLPSIGIGQGLQPLVGYNYGAGNHRRVNRNGTPRHRRNHALFLRELRGHHALHCSTGEAFQYQRPGAAGYRHAGTAPLLPRRAPCGIGVISSFTFQGLGKARQSLFLASPGRSSASCRRFLSCPDCLGRRYLAFLSGGRRGKRRYWRALSLRAVSQHEAGENVPGHCPPCSGQSAQEKGNARQDHDEEEQIVMRERRVRTARRRIPCLQKRSPRTKQPSAAPKRVMSFKSVPSRIRWCRGNTVWQAKEVRFFRFVPAALRRQHRPQE
jgi:putative MATE family efflux protein